MFRLVFISALILLIIYPFTRLIKPMWLAVLLSSIVFIFEFSVFFMPRWGIINFSRNIYIFSGLLLGITLILFLLVFVKDIFLILNYLFCNKILVNHFKINLTIVVFSVVLGTIGLWEGIKVPSINKFSIQLPNLPDKLNGFRIIQLSDLHMGDIFIKEWLQAVVSKVNALKPDIVVITGDLVDKSPVILGEEIKLLTQVSSKYGTFICVGNHEYYAGLAEWLNFWKEIGLNVLLNSHAVLNIDGTALVVAGIADRGHNHPKFESDDIIKAFSGAPGNAFQILLAHRPENARKHAEQSNNIALQLSGHTHGGQIPILWPLVSIVNNGFIKGLYKIENMFLYISNGTGLWGGFPIRLFTPSEITEIILLSESSTQE